MKQQLKLQKKDRVIVNSKFALIKCIYTGKTSTIFEAYDIVSNSKCIVKMVLNMHQREISVRLLQALSQGNFSSRIGLFSPKVLDRGIFQNDYAYIAMNKCGPSLKMWFRVMNQKFSLDTIILIAYRTLNILEQLHECGYVHGSLKLASILTALEGSKLLLTDLNECSRYTKNFKDVKGQYVSTYVNKYSSCGKHLNSVPCPKDDLECLSYILINLLYNGKFFSGEKNGKNHFDRKLQIIPERDLKQFPQCFTTYFNRVKSLNPTQIPINYEFLKQPFHHYLDTHGAKHFDWTFLFEKFRSQSQSLQVSSTTLDEVDETPDCKVKSKFFLPLPTIQERTENFSSSIYLTSITMLKHHQQKPSGDSMIEVNSSDDSEQLEDEPTDRSLLPSFF